MTVQIQQQNSDFAWFKANYDELSEKYNGKYIAIKDKTVLGDYTSYGEAVRQTELFEKRGTYIVQKCNGKESGYTNYISSMNFMGVL